MAIGMFIDAETQLASQRLLQEIQAQTHKDYRPSIGMCKFGSLSKGLANSDIRADTYAVAMSMHSLDRQLGKGDMSGTYGHDLDQNNRILQFKRVFCNQKSRDSALENVCDDLTAWDSNFKAEERGHINKDIDYFSLIDKPWTVKIDFSNQSLEDATAIPKIDNKGEEHVMAMAANLFGHVTFARSPARSLINKPSEISLSPMQKLYMDMRAVVAKRSVAENSLYAIAAMKAQSPNVKDYAGGANKVETNAKPFIENILRELGVPDSELSTLMTDNPSYYTQMEILTKKLYQNPNFYINLYDTPANIERKTVALEAIKLMQKFDMLKSYLRDEMNVSLLLEMAVIELQNEVEDQIQALE
ncbi:MAG: hypothetical protein KAJ40_03575, partial [Alphaproteobacteria bacterium]|nr:hypothetical protein [Alphaproteobacteria bacterium]